MNKNLLFARAFLILGLGMAFFLLSCSEDEATKPVASFTSEVTDLVVDFTNTSTDATAYLWDFGDDSTSTEKSPSYTYADFGTFSVTLTVTGPGGTASVSEDVVLASSEPVLIDGTFTDWASVPVLGSYPDGEGRTLLEAKVTNSDGFLYFYLKGTASLGQVLQVFIDADNSGDSGWGYWSYFELPGFEYMMETVVVGWDGTDPSSSLQAATGENSDWPWEELLASNAIFAASEYVAVDGNKVIEFSMLRDIFSTPALGSTIRIVFGNSDNTWANVGHLPPSAQDPLLAPMSYTMQ